MWSGKWRQRQERLKHALRNSRLHRILGERLFHIHVWKIDKRSIAGGLSLGLFVAFTPTIPFQMFLCAVGCVFLRLNLPVAWLACWVTNPLTALPIYLAARRLGIYLLRGSGIAAWVLELFHFTGTTARVIEQSLYLWSGCLIFSTVSALLANLVVRLLWRLPRRIHPKAAR